MATTSPRQATSFIVVGAALLVLSSSTLSAAYARHDGFVCDNEGGVKSEVATSKAIRPAPELFSDHRAYLEAMVHYLKQTRRRFSYRYFAKRGGFSSPSFLKLVIQGKRKLTPKSIGRFATALGLDRRERQVFEALVHFSQATTDEERNHYYLSLRDYGGTKDETLELTKAQYDVYSLWYAMPIREMVALPEFKEDPAWIAERMRPRIRVEQAKHALRRLEEVGLLTREAGGRLVRSSSKVAAVKQVQALAVRNYHRATLALGARSLTELPGSRRNVTSLTVTLTNAQYKEVCERIAALQRELLDVVEDAPPTQEAREVYVLAVQVFPVTERS